MFFEPSTTAGVYEVGLSGELLPDDRSGAVLYEIFREWPEETSDVMTDAEREARSAYISMGHKQMALDLWRRPSKQWWEERQQSQRSALSFEERQRYLNHLSQLMRATSVALGDTPPIERTRAQYLTAYATYIRTRQLLGAEFNRLIVHPVKAGKLKPWRWFFAWRNQQRKLRSPKRIAWLKEVHPRLPSQKAATAKWNASESARDAKRRYAQSEKGKAARAKREAARAKKDADLLAIPDDEYIAPEFLQ